MDQKSNVLTFPRRHDETSPQTVAESVQHLTEVKIEHNREIVEFTFDMALGTMRSFGFFNKPEKIHDHDLMMIEETIMSALCRYNGIPHPLHDLTDLFFDDTILEVGEGDEDEEDDDLEEPEKVTPL